MSEGPKAVSESCFWATAWTNARVHSERFSNCANTISRKSGETLVSASINAPLAAGSFVAPSASAMRR